MVSWKSWISGWIVSFTSVGWRRRGHGIPIYIPSSIFPSKCRTTRYCARDILRMSYDRTKKYGITTGIINYKFMSLGMIDFAGICYPKLTSSSGITEALQNTLEYYWISSPESSDSDIDIYVLSSLDVNDIAFKCRTSSNDFECIGMTYMSSHGWLSMNFGKVIIYVNPYIRTRVSISHIKYGYVSDHVLWIRYSRYII